MGNSKKRKIVLIDPISTADVYRKKRRIGYGEKLEPLGLLYVAAALKKASFEVEVIAQGTRDKKEISEEIERLNPDIVGFTCVTSNFPAAADLAKYLKKNCGVTIIFGGIHASTCPEIVKEPFINFVVIGEGEETTVELTQNLDYRERWNKIKGIGYIHPKTGKLHLTPPRERVKSIDVFPFPYRSKNLMNNQFTNILSYPSPPEQRVASMISSKGCRYNCYFCTNKAMWGTSIAGWSPENIVDEIELLVKDYNRNYIWFHDENFVYDKEQTIAICDEIIKRGLNNKVHWYCEGCISDINGEILQHMKEAGCSQIAYGVESGSQLLLRRFHKPQTIDMIKKVFEVTFETGIIPTALFVIGDPCETYETLKETEKTAKEIKALRYRFSILYPYRGTALRKEVDKQKLWISEAHKSYRKASTEVAVMKCGVDEGILNTFHDRMNDEIYSSDEYLESVERFLNIDNKFIVSFKYFFKILEGQGVKINRNRIERIIGDF